MTNVAEVTAVGRPDPNSTPDNRVEGEDGVVLVGTLKGRLSAHGLHRNPLRATYVRDRFAGKPARG